MSNPKFVVLKLKDLKIPFLIFLIGIALIILLLFKGKSATQTFAPLDTYQDGKYIAGISLSDEDMDLIVEVKNGEITSVSLDGLKDSHSELHTDLLAGINYVNTYVTATQSTSLPTNANTSAATNMLMDAVKIALNDEVGTQITSTYETVDLNTAQPTNSLTPTSDQASNEANNPLSTDEIFVDEFEDPDLDNAQDSASSDDLTFEQPDSAEQDTEPVTEDNTHSSALEENIEQ